MYRLGLAGNDDEVAVVTDPDRGHRALSPSRSSASAAPPPRAARRGVPLARRGPRARRGRPRRPLPRSAGGDRSSGRSPPASTAMASPTSSPRKDLKAAPTRCARPRPPARPPRRRRAGRPRGDASLAPVVRYVSPRPAHRPRPAAAPPVWSRGSSDPGATSATCRPGRWRRPSAGCAPGALRRRCRACCAAASTTRTARAWEELAFLDELRPNSCAGTRRRPSPRAVGEPPPALAARVHPRSSRSRTAPRDQDRCAARWRRGGCSGRSLRVGGARRRHDRPRPRRRGVAVSRPRVLVGTFRDRRLLRRPRRRPRALSAAQVTTAMSVGARVLQLHRPPLRRRPRRRRARRLARRRRRARRRPPPARSRRDRRDGAPRGRPRRVRDGRTQALRPWHPTVPGAWASGAKVRDAGAPRQSAWWASSPGRSSATPRPTTSQCAALGHPRAPTMGEMAACWADRRSPPSLRNLRMTERHAAAIFAAQPVRASRRPYHHLFAPVALDRPTTPGARPRGAGGGPRPPTAA